MSIQERPRVSLTDQIRQEIAFNRAKGDREHRWKTYGSNIDSYDKTFRLALGGTSIASFIKDRKSPVVVDLMAPSHALQSLFRKVPDKNKFGLAVSLSDERTTVRKWIDRVVNIRQLSGDIMLPATWRNIDGIMQGRKADLIMERAFAGLNIIPRYPKLYAILINKAWRILSDKEGVMLLQIPFDDRLLTAGICVQYFVSDLRTKGINVERFEEGVSSDRSVLKLIKTPDSSENLPFLK